MFGFKLGAVRHALTLRVSLVFRACGESNYAFAVLLLALTQTCGFISETHPPALHCPMPGFARIDSSFSALSWVASGPILVSGPPVCGLLVSGPWGVGTHAAPPKRCIYTEGHALSCLFTFRGVNVPPAPGALVPWKQCNFQQSR